MFFSASACGRSRSDKKQMLLVMSEICQTAPGSTQRDQPSGFVFCLYLTYNEWPMVNKDLPISSRFSPYEFYTWLNAESLSVQNEVVNLSSLF